MADLWLKTSTSLQEHPKTGALADALNIPVPYAGGLVVFLWHKILVRQEDGNLAGCSDQQLARWAGWRGDASKFVGALLEAGFMDTDRTVHNWDVYTKELRAKRARDRATAERRRLMIKAQSVEKSRDSRGDFAATSPRLHHDVSSQELELEKDKVKSSSPSTVHRAAAACPAPSANGTGLSPVAIDHTIATYTAQGYTRSQVEEALVVVAARIAEGKTIRNLTAYVGTILHQDPTAAATPEEPERRDNGCGAPPELIAERRAKRLAREREVFGE